MKTTAGVGKFTGIGSVRDLLGHYANAETHAGAEKVGRGVRSLAQRS
ncbi:MAG TPA: hypothetical protein VFE75_14350 [Rhodanobacter sp.]|nr:hypothetical protein [Rhodanobacter sp.]